jgi:putative transposase
VLTPVWSRALPSAPSSVRVSRDTTGKWWASFVVRVQTQPLAPNTETIGVDWGVTETATTTDQTFDLPHAGHGKAAAAKLARYQKMMARREPPKGRPASKGYREAKKLAAEVSGQVARQRTDDARQVGQRRRPVPPPDRRRGLQAEVPGQIDHGQKGGRRSHRSGQAGTDLDGGKT